MVSQLNNGLSLHCPTALPTFFSRSLPTSAFQRRPCLSSLVNYRSSLRVRCTAGRVKQQSQHLPVKNPTNDEKIPHLVHSMAIRGLPPRQRSMFVVEAEERLMKIAEHWQIKSLESYCRLSISLAGFIFSGAVSSDRLVAVSISNLLMFVLDDLLFDCPDDLLLEEYGIDRRIRESPHTIGEFVKHLNLLLRQQEPLRDPTPIEGIMWELGRDLRRLSTPEWFNTFADAVMEHHRVGVASHADIAGDRLYLQDLESFTQMRAWNAGALLTVNLVEVAKNAFLPAEVRAQPIIQQLTNAALIQSSFVNDIFSYPKEVQEDNPRNLIMVLMHSEDILLPQAACRAVDVVNSYARVVLELETQLETQLAVWDAEPWDHVVRRYVEGVKELMSGNLHWHSLDKRYRNPDSVSQSSGPSMSISNYKTFRT